MKMTPEQHFDTVCKAWNFTPELPVCSGYESVSKELAKFSKDDWEGKTEQQQEQLVDTVFDIYRSIDLVPITYYNLDGCKQELISLSRRAFKVEQGRIQVGGTAGQSFSRFWFPNMQEAYSRTDKMVSLKARFYNDTRLKRAIKICFKYRDEQNPVNPKNLRRALDLVSGGTIQNFKPLNARAVWEHVCQDFMGRVLDFSSGYGGRMMGAMTSRLGYHYTGIDPNTKTHEALTALGELCNQLRLGRGYEMHNIPSEQFQPEPGAYDAAFSSPPYFNLETYCDEPTQCMNNFSDVDAWFDGYVKPTLEMIHLALRDEGMYAVNIADYKVDKTEFEIVERWKDISKQTGFKFVEQVNMMLNVRPGVGNHKDQSAFKSEGIYIFQK